MRFAWITVGLAAAAAPISAQATIRLMAGATLSTPLIDDGALLTQLTPAIAPAIGLGISMPTGQGGYRILLEGDVRRGALDAVNNDPDDRDQGAHDRINTLTTVDALALFEGPVHGRIRWQAGGGAVFYLPADKEGVFQDGGTHRWVLTLGVLWSRPINPRWTLLAQGRIDYQEFTTDILKLRGYGEFQSVQRFTLQAGLEHPL